MDVINLSVDLDPDDDEDDGPEPEPPIAQTPDMPDPPSPPPVKGITRTPLAKAVELPKPKEDPKLELRAAARKAVTTVNYNQAVVDKHHWMVVTVPEQPTAGEECILLFNRMQSEALRSRPRIQLIYGFNHWELKAEAGDRADLLPTSIPKDAGSDFWSCKIKVPEDAYELNFVLTDGQSLYENNSGQDFTYQIAAGITWDEWLDQASERAAKAEAAKQAAEKAAAEEAERQRQAALLQQDRDRGNKRAQDLKNGLENLQKGGVSSLARADGLPVFKVKPEQPVAGGKVTLYYNPKATNFHFLNIPEGEALLLKYGFNGWQKPGSIKMKRSPPPKPAAAAAKAADAAAEAPAAAAPAPAPANEDWWEAEVSVPLDAAALNFVMNYYEHYDNNGQKDYKVKLALPAGKTLEQWAEDNAERYRQEEFEARMKVEEEERIKEAIRQEKRRKAQDMVRAVERRKVRHVLFTEPEVVTAGQDVTLFYNPRDTPLNGRQRIFLQGGWNRWSHARKFGPIEMQPNEEGVFAASVKVPPDAFKMDFVFSDVEGGEGTYDNRGGFDYHLPVEGSLVREPSLYVAHIAVEMAPVAKVGGLGDVVTALGRAVKEQGHLVEVILPKYEFFNYSPVLQGQMKFETEYDWGGTRIVVTSAMVEGLRCFFIEPRNGFFNTQTVYGRYDDEVRFDFFCKAALEFLLRTNRQPDILHCHDWSTAHVAKSYWEDYHPYGLWKPKVVFTIHNLQYGQKKIGEAAFYCQKFTTVSPTYAFEVGGNAVIASHGHKFMGIRNGIDMDLWDPEHNIWLPKPFTAENVVEGKRAARIALRQRLNLTDWNDKYIVGVVSRLTPQKGVHLIKHAAYRATERGGQFVLLGSAPDPKVQAEFNELAQQYNGQDASFCFKYDEPLSHLIYAACDIIIVPSMFEPCGLTQMIAMRYGAVPIVRHTGGLKDTVFDVDFDKARAAWDVYGSSDWQRDSLDATNGFAFEGTDPGALDYAMNRAIDAWYNDRAWFHSLQKRVMEQDWSWNRPALDYIELYHSAKKV